MLVDPRKYPTLRKGWPKGMDNILADHEIPDDTLRNAVNVDVLDSGKVRLRKGCVQRISGPAHSLWSNGVFALVYSGGALNSLSPSNTLTVLRAGVADKPLSYTEAGTDIYWSNGIDYGRISGGVDMPWGVEAPRSSPLLASIAGSMPVGRYQALVTFISSSGEESAASSSVAVDSTGGIAFTLPQPATADVVTVRLYLTPWNGDVFYRIGDFAVGTTAFNLVATPVYGQVCKTQFLQRFLPCDIVEHWRGCIYGAVGNVLWRTQAYNFGLYRPSTNFTSFPSDIRLVAGVAGGMYVVCDRTYWLAGSGPDDLTFREILPYGGARRSLARHPGNKSVIWFGDMGQVIGDEQGNVIEQHAAHVLPGAYHYGATIVREQDSLRQIVSVVTAPSDSSVLPAQDFLDAEIIRHRKG